MGPPPTPLTPHALFAAGSFIAVLVGSAIGQQLLVLVPGTRSKSGVTLAILPLAALPAIAVFESLSAPELKLSPLTQTWNVVLAYWPFIIAIAVALTASFWGNIRTRLGRWMWLLAAILAIVDLAEIGVTAALVIAFSS